MIDSNNTIILKDISQAQNVSSSQYRSAAAYVATTSTTRMCALCGESTGDMIATICPTCKKIWLILKESFMEDLN